MIWLLTLQLGVTVLWTAPATTADNQPLTALKGFRVCWHTVPFQAGERADCTTYVPHTTPGAPVQVSMQCPAAPCYYAVYAVDEAGDASMLTPVLSTAQASSSPGGFRLRGGRLLGGRIP